MKKVGASATHISIPSPLRSHTWEKQARAATPTWPWWKQRDSQTSCWEDWWEPPYLQLHSQVSCFQTVHTHHAVCACACLWFFFVSTKWLMNGEINTYVVLACIAWEIHMQNEGIHKVPGCRERCESHAHTNLLICMVCSLTVLTRMQMHKS